MLTLKELLKCGLIAAAIAFVGFGIRVEIEIQGAVQSLAEVPDLVDHRVGSLQVSVLSSVDDLVTRTDKRTGQALAIVNKLAATLPALVDRHATNVEQLADRQLTATNATLATTAAKLSANVAPLGDLARRYTLLPDQVRADREYQGLVAETMGVLGATKVTMGQTAKAAKTFEDNFPALIENGDHIAASADGIAADIKREADDLTGPKTFWAQLRTWLLTVARIYGAL